MSNKNPHLNLNDPAFSYAAEWGYSTGLTKRELFAAMAMNGINSNPECYGMSSQDKAVSALQDADALINALNAE